MKRSFEGKKFIEALFFILLLMKYNKKFTFFHESKHYYKSIANSSLDENL